MLYIKELQWLKTSVTTLKTIQCNIPEDPNLQYISRVQSCVFSKTPCPYTPIRRTCHWCNVPNVVTCQYQPSCTSTFTFRVTTDLNVIYQVQVFYRVSLLRETLNIESNVFLTPWTLKRRSQWPRGLRRLFAAGCALAGVAGSNLVGDMDICLLWVLCVVR
jgi:hypothetical protein